jgi:hypothetical protein
MRIVAKQIPSDKVQNLQDKKDRIKITVESATQKLKW